MIGVRVEYDAYNRTFKLVDREFGSVLEDGAIYELLAPFALLELEEDTVLQSAESFCSSH
jgi:hypothetical protein